MSDNQEIRIYDINDMEVRELEDGPPEIHGYAAVFNRRSRPLGGFVEEILPGAFKKTLSSLPDVRATIDHEGGLTTLGRTRNGTLELNEDDYGLRVRILPPDTQAGRDALKLVRGGYINQMSFKFRVPKDGDSWQQRPGSLPLRRLREVDLSEGDVAIVTYPAYPQTTAEARDMANSLTIVDSGPVAAEAGQDGEGAGDAEAMQVQADLQRRLAEIDAKENQSR